MPDIASVQNAIAGEHERFQFALGKLTLKWANLEGALYTVLRHYAGVSTEVARALFSGSRAKGMIDFIKAIAHNTTMNPSRLADLNEIFERASMINTMRDRLVHHVDGSIIEYDEDDPSTRFLSNERRVSRIDNAYRMKVGSADIEAMSADLDECCWRLVAHPDNTNDPFKPGVGPTGKRIEFTFKMPHLSKG